MYFVVFAVGLPTAFRNLTALALSLAWMAGEVTWLLTGNNLPLSTYFMADVAVISLIYAKTIKRVGVKKYPTLVKQCYCFLLDLTICDRCVVAIFLLGCWPLYILAVDPYTKWWSLYWLTILQFLLAGAEASSLLHREIRERAKSEHSDNGLALAGVYWKDG
jgi:hypothetical protein